MTLEDIKEWLQVQIKAPAFFIGKIDSSIDNCIGVYNIPGPSPNVAIGGLQNTTYAIKSISILVHWGKNSNAAELKAQEIYNKLFCQNAVIKGKRVILFDVRTSGPIDVGTDDKGIYEYVIQTNIIYER